MQATKISDLLPIPEGSQQPHAYQVFGLEDGEQDPEVIAEAVKQTIDRLKASKPNTDAKLWAKAAKLAQDARVTLADPAKKSQLDARFGIISFEDETPQDPSQPADQPGDSNVADPLAGVLPSADPLASVLPSSDPLQAAAPVDPLPSVTPVPADPGSQVQAASPDNVMPAGLFGTPESDPNAGSQPSVSPVVVKVKKTKRRKSSMVTTVLFSFFTIGMLALIGGLSYFLFGGSGVSITKQDGELRITTKPNEEDANSQVSPPADAPPRRRESRPSHDPVMGDLAGDVPPPTRPQQPSGLAKALKSAVPQLETDASPMTIPPEQPLPEPPVSDQPPSVPSQPPTEPTPDPEPEMTAPTEEMVAKSEQSLDQVRSLIRESKWGEMKTAAESISKSEMSKEQQTEADGLYELADLATFYRGGIERAVADLNVGNDFAVTESFRVIVVEKGDDLLVLRRDQKNYSFTFDEFPFPLAHKLATFSLSEESPTNKAAKAAYQAIAPKATPAHRDEAVSWLMEITEEVEGADPKRVAEIIKSLYGDDA